MFGSVPAIILCSWTLLWIKLQVHSTWTYLPYSSNPISLNSWPLNSTLPSTYALPYWKQNLETVWCYAWRRFPGNFDPSYHVTIWQDTGVVRLACKWTERIHFPAYYTCRIVIISYCALLWVKILFLPFTDPKTCE